MGHLTSKLAYTFVRNEGPLPLKTFLYGLVESEKKMPRQELRNTLQKLRHVLKGRLSLEYGPGNLQETGRRLETLQKREVGRISTMKFMFVATQILRKSMVIPSLLNLLTTTEFSGWWDPLVAARVFMPMRSLGTIYIRRMQHRNGGMVTRGSP